jgi:hypothetical protein
MDQQHEPAPLPQSWSTPHILHEGSCSATTAKKPHAWIPRQPPTAHNFRHDGASICNDYNCTLSERALAAATAVFTGHQNAKNREPRFTDADTKSSVGHNLRYYGPSIYDLYDDSSPHERR